MKDFKASIPSSDLGFSNRVSRGAKNRFAPVRLGSRRRLRYTAETNRRLLRVLRLVGFCEYRRIQLSKGRQNQKAI